MGKRLVLPKKNEGERGTELVLRPGRVLLARLRICDLFRSTRGLCWRRVMVHVFKAFPAAVWGIGEQLGNLYRSQIWRRSGLAWCGNGERGTGVGRAVDGAPGCWGREKERALSRPFMS